MISAKHVIGFLCLALVLTIVLSTKKPDQLPKQEKRKLPDVRWDDPDHFDRLPPYGSLSPEDEEHAQRIINRWFLRRMEATRRRR